MKLSYVFLSLSIMITASCAPTSTYAKSRLDVDYERQHQQAEKAFNELDKEIHADNKTKKLPIDNSTSTNSTDKKPEYIEKKSPNSVVEKARPGAYNKSNIDEPCWVLNPMCVEGYKLLAVGSAQEQNGGEYAQKKSATLQARGELSRMITIYIENELKTTEIYDRENHKNDYNRYIETYSRQRSSSYIDNITEVDSYKDKDNNIFILLGIK